MLLVELPLNALFFSLRLLSKEHSNVLLLKSAIPPGPYPVCPELPFVAPSPDRIYMYVQQARNITCGQERGNFLASGHSCILSLATVKLLIAILTYQFGAPQ
jgi:hypothetical protein